MIQEKIEMYGEGSNLPVQQLMWPYLPPFLPTFHCQVVHVEKQLGWVMFVHFKKTSLSIDSQWRMTSSYSEQTIGWIIYGLA